MGYESKLYVVQKYDTKYTDCEKLYYADIIATFKLSKIGGYDLFKSYPATLQNHLCRLEVISLKQYPMKN
jgi:hypothetical protein